MMIDRYSDFHVWLFFMFSIYFHGGGDTQEMEPQKHHPVMDDLGGFPATIGWPWMFVVLVDRYIYIYYNLKWWCNHTDDIWFLEWYYSWVSCDQIGSNLVSKWLWFKWCLDKKLVYGIAGTKWMFTPQNVALMLTFPDRINVLPQVIFIRRDNMISIYTNFI